MEIPFSEGCSEVSRHAGVGVTGVTCGCDHECAICALIPQMQENFYTDLRTVQTQSYVIITFLSYCIYNHLFLFKGNDTIDKQKEML